MTLRCFSAVDIAIAGNPERVLQFHCTREKGHDDWHTYERGGVPWFVWQGDRPMLGPEHGGPMEKMAWETAK